MGHHWDNESMSDQVSRPLKDRARCFRPGNRAESSSTGGTLGIRFDDRIRRSKLSGRVILAPSAQGRNIRVI